MAGAGRPSLIGEGAVSGGVQQPHAGPLEEGGLGLHALDPVEVHNHRSVPGTRGGGWGGEGGTTEEGSGAGERH